MNSAVWPAWQNSDAVLVSEPYSYQYGVSAGDDLVLPTDRGPQEFRVAATFQSYDINASGVMMSRATYARHFDDDNIDSLGLYLADGVSADAVVERVRALSEGRQRLYVNSNAGLREESMRIFDRTFVITDILYWLTLGVAFIGILAEALQSLADAAGLGDRQIEIFVEEPDEHCQRLGFAQVVLPGEVFDGAEVKCHDPALFRRIAADILGIDPDNGGRGETPDEAAHLVQRRPGWCTFRKQPVEKFHGGRPGSAAAWPGEVPDDDAEQRQHQHQHDPQGLFQGVGRTLEDVQNGPDIGNQHQ